MILNNGLAIKQSLASFYESKWNLVCTLSIEDMRQQNNRVYIPVEPQKMVTFMNGFFIMTNSTQKIIFPSAIGFGVVGAPDKWAIGQSAVSTPPIEVLRETTRPLPEMEACSSHLVVRTGETTTNLDNGSDQF